MVKSQSQFDFQYQKHECQVLEDFCNIYELSLTKYLIYHPLVLYQVHEFLMTQRKM